MSSTNFGSIFIFAGAALLVLVIYYVGEFAFMRGVLFFSLKNIHVVYIFCLVVHYNTGWCWYFLKMFSGRHP